MEALQTAITHWEDALERLEEYERVTEVSQLPGKITYFIHCENIYSIHLFCCLFYGVMPLKKKLLFFLY